MQIGGNDYIIETTHPAELMEAATKWLMERWPDGLISVGKKCAGGFWFNTGYHLIPFGTETELFFTAQIGGGELFHLLRRPGELTVVTDVGSIAGTELVDVLTHTRFPGAL